MGVISDIGSWIWNHLPSKAPPGGLVRTNNPVATGYAGLNERKWKVYQNEKERREHEMKANYGFWYDAQTNRWYNELYYEPGDDPLPKGLIIKAQKPAAPVYARPNMSDAEWSRQFGEIEGRPRNNNTTRRGLGHKGPAWLGASKVEFKPRAWKQDKTFVTYYSSAQGRKDWLNSTYSNNGKLDSSITAFWDHWKDTKSPPMMSINVKPDRCRFETQMGRTIYYDCPDTIGQKKN